MHTVTFDTNVITVLAVMSPHWLVWAVEDVGLRSSTGNVI